MKKLLLPLFFIICIFLGFLFHAYLAERLIILYTFNPKNIDSVHNNDESFKQQETILSFYKSGKWHQEKSSIIWSHILSENIKSITNEWLLLLEDEKIIENDIQVTSIVISPAKELFLSLNKNWFPDQASTFYKFMILQGFLKTLKDNKIEIQSVRFLIHHQPFEDDHINLAISWPITGYNQTT